VQVTVQLTLIGIAVGVPIGCMVLSSEWEKKVRRLPPSWLPFGHRSLLAILLGTFLVKIPFGFVLFLGIPYFALNYYGFIPLLGDGYRVFFLAYLLSVGVGKLIRYGYWRWRFRNQLV
jgi:hypothetical protein